MGLWLAVTRADVADYVQTLAYVYLVLIFIRIILSWIPRMPYNRWLNAGVKFVSDVTDPHLMALATRELTMISTNVATIGLRSRAPGPSRTGGRTRRNRFW